MESGIDIAMYPPKDIAYQHTVFCQTCLPYRNPGDEVRVWERRQGQVLLRVEAGAALNPGTNEFIELGLPFGPKSRLILSHLNSEAIKTGSPVIEVEKHFTGFVKRLIDPLKSGRSSPNGREINLFKTQLSALAASSIRLGIKQDQRAVTIKSEIVQAFDLWFSKGDNQRILWPSILRLSDEYFNSLVIHAVPLDERALTALAHSAMALDIYTWLAQRLHRVPANHPHIDVVKLGFGTAFVTPNLKEKLSVYREYDMPVYFGGTLFEAFLIRNQFEDYIAVCKEFGVSYMEVSDGSITIPHAEKCGYIEKLSKHGVVLSEVGSKDAAHIIPPYKWIELMSAELSAGAAYVIAEAREAGNVGIYRGSGEVREGLVQEILTQIPAEKILWEAPQKAQQLYFLELIGCNVNLGNIAPSEIIALEAMRIGLRGDTFELYLDKK